MSVAIMLGGSAGWVLPYSYQCNLMVMAAGGYRTKDFAKFGAPFHVSDRRWVVRLVVSPCFQSSAFLRQLGKRIDTCSSSVRAINNFGNQTSTPTLDRHAHPTHTTHSSGC